MDTTPAEGTILKNDVLGRVKMPAARREQLLDEFEKSGLGGQKFAELAGIKYQTFASWAQARRRTQAGSKAPAKPASPVRWVEAVVEQAQTPVPSKASSFLLLQLPGGARVELADEKQMPLAAALLRTLESPCGRPPSC